MTLADHAGTCARWVNHSDQVNVSQTYDETRPCTCGTSGDAGIRRALVAAKLATQAFIASDGYTSLGVRSNEEAADVALFEMLPFLAAAERRGYDRAVAIVRRALETAQAETRPRTSRAPRSGITILTSERAGRTTALGMVLNELEATKETTL